MVALAQASEAAAGRDEGEPRGTSPLTCVIDVYSSALYSGLVLQVVTETPVFTRQADALLSGDERDELVLLLAREPLAGDLIPGLGGIRKLRFGAGGRGKRGGSRVIYCVADDAIPVPALLLYGKNERADLSPDQRRIMRAFVEQWREEMARRPGRA